MDLKEMVLRYNPVDEQEESDKREILQYIDTFNNVLSRENEVAHFTSSAFIVNKSRDKVLVVHHNIYNCWTWAGGHADGESNLLNVALREVREETGLKNIKPILNSPLLINISITEEHIKNGKKVPTHKHLSVAYLIEADENEKLSIQEEENSGVKWIPFDEILETLTNPYMKVSFEKAIEKIKEQCL